MNKRQRKKLRDRIGKKRIAIPASPKQYLGYPYNLKDGSGIFANISLYGFSEQGRAHWLYNEECQDNCSAIFSEKMKCLIVAISDGVGSCENAKAGAYISVTEATNYIYKQFENYEGKLRDDKMKSMLKGAMESAYDAIILEADKNGKSVDEYNSTLTIAVFDGNDLFIGHIGDDGVLAVSNEGYYGLITTRHKGKDPSSLYPLKVKEKWEFLHASSICGFIMATDGVLDVMVHSRDEESRVFLPIVNAAINRKLDSSEKAERLLQEYYTYFNSENIKAVITDDITFVCVFNERTKANLSTIMFDQLAWEEQNKKYALDEHQLENFEKKDARLMEGLPSLD